MPGLEADRVEQIDAALTAAGGGVPTLLVIEGLPGSGKSSLLRTVVEHAGERFGSAMIESTEGDRRPYVTLSRLGVKVTPQASPLVVANAVRDHFDAAAAERPVLIAVDDVQWADRETVATLLGLVDRVDRDELLVALAMHPLPLGVHEELQDFVASGRARRLHIDGLPFASATAMARAVHPFIDEPTVERLWRLTNGNPLYMSSILRECGPDELARMAFLPAPQEFARSVAQRVDRLGPAAVALLRASAVLGTDWQPVPTVAAVAGVRAPSASIEALMKAGLLVHRPSFELGGSIRPVHELVLAAVYQQMSLDERRELHLSAASFETDLNTALGHRVAAADEFDPDLADELEAAARRNHEVSAFRPAADQLGWSSRLSADARLRRDRHLDGLFERILANDLAGIDHEVERAGYDHRVASIVGALAVFDNRWHDAIRALEPVLDEPTGATDPLLRYRCEVLAAYAGMGAGEPTDWVQARLLRARETGANDPALLGFQTLAEGRVHARRSGTAGFRAYWEGLTVAATEVPVGSTYRLMIRGISRVADGAFSEAIADLDEVERRFHRGIIDVADGLTHSSLGVAHWLRGDWQLAEVKFRTAREMQRKILNPLTSAITTIGSTGAGDFAATDLVLRDVRMRLLRQPWAEGILWYATARSIRLHAGADAGAQAGELDDLERDFGPAAVGTGPGFPLWLIHRIPLSIWAGRLDEASTLISSFHQVQGHLPWMTGVEHWFQGLVAEQRQQAGRARRHFDDALNGDIGHIPLLAAHVLADRARIDGDTTTRDSAVEAYRALGQVPYVKQLASTERTRVEARPIVFERLSDRERDVLALVTSGLSYEQIGRNLFISRSTVGFHLSNIYAKTGTTSRHDLTALARG
ncbi:helix-turn-helix transcriptional regulator [Leifsonia flava]|uniref:Helix-turn-helix transcriptional regulator n=1 Tax=Orlajensenia leifsoniae TaxID=2561933 RepID=A0A4Y9R7L3_9MICO|nr:LuxR C-terminal-related transcriptional regulator [Leifsonia flava]TFV99912.1 helix-turn-helix transcriptional regulator [Leifsonia flava]